MKNILIFFLALSLFACNQQEFNLNGLWKVEEVKFGNETMTPDAKWMKFSDNYTYASGNGWNQHTVGKFVAGGDSLSIINTYGVLDEYGPFTYHHKSDTLILSRSEENNLVTVTLSKTEYLPTRKADLMLGLWSKETQNGIDPSFLVDQELEKLFLRWDGRYRILRDSSDEHGVYNFHGHKQEIELIPYGNPERSFWTFEMKGDSMMLKKLGENNNAELKFKRIQKF